MGSGLGLGGGPSSSASQNGSLPPRGPGNVRGESRVAKNSDLARRYLLMNKSAAPRRNVGTPLLERGHTAGERAVRSLVRTPLDDSSRTSAIFQTPTLLTVVPLNKKGNFGKCRL